MGKRSQKVSKFSPNEFSQKYVSNNFEILGIFFDMNKGRGPPVLTLTGPHFLALTRWGEDPTF